MKTITEKEIALCNSGYWHGEEYIVIYSRPSESIIWGCGKTEQEAIQNATNYIENYNLKNEEKYDIKDCVVYKTKDSGDEFYQEKITVTVHSKHPINVLMLDGNIEIDLDSRKVIIK